MNEITMTVILINLRVKKRKEKSPERQVELFIIPLTFD